MGFTRLPWSFTASFKGNLWVPLVKVLAWVVRNFEILLRGHLSGADVRLIVKKVLGLNTWMNFWNGLYWVLQGLIGAGAEVEGSCLQVGSLYDSYDALECILKSLQQGLQFLSNCRDDSEAFDEVCTVA